MFANRATVESLEDRKLFSVVAAIGAGNSLFFFDSADPTDTIAKLKVKGLARGESLVGIDFRPVNNQLFGLSSESRLYRIDTSTGQTTAVGTAAFAPALAGTSFGFDFNPSVDRIRVVSDLDVNFRLNPDDGTVVDFDTVTADTQTDLPLTYVTGDANFGANPNIVAGAYTNSVPGGTPTTLYAIDADTNALVAIGSVDGVTDSPNNGNVTTIGGLGVDVTSVAGFDIESDGVNDVAYASLATGNGRSGFYTINLSTGVATLVGEIRGSKTPVTGLTVVPAGSTVVALAAKNRLFTVNAVLPGLKSSPVKISGLARNEKIISIDERPLDGVLYGFSNQNRVYAINAGTGAATAAGSQNTTTLNKKAKLDMDFNPSVDRFRVINTARENARYNPADGQIVDADTVTAGVQLDGPTVYASTDVNSAATPKVSGIAYGTNVAGTPTTTLFGIDATQDVLVTVGTADGSTSPNTGQLFTVGALGVDVKDASYFDIVTTNSVDSAFAIIKPRSGGAQLFSINLTTGAATSLGKLAKGVNAIGMAIV